MAISNRTKNNSNVRKPNPNYRSGSPSARTNLSKNTVAVKNSNNKKVVKSNNQNLNSKAKRPNSYNRNTGYNPNRNTGYNSNRNTGYNPNRNNNQTYNVNNYGFNQGFNQPNNNFNQNYPNVNSQYRLPEDKKVKKQRDYFYVMRKGACFFMFLLLLISIALFVVSYLNLEIVPKQYIALGNEQIVNEETSVTSTNYYSVLDPVYGVIKKVTGQFMGKEINLGESPLYDNMIAKVEIMDNQIYKILMTYSPILLILFVIIAIVMMFKALFGMFGKRIFKLFGLGSFLMLISGVAIAFSMLAYTTEVGTKMQIAKIVDILIGSFKGATSLVGGYGLLALIGLSLLTLIFSMFARKKVPYSIFDV